MIAIGNTLRRIASKCAGSKDLSERQNFSGKFKTKEELLNLGSPVGKLYRNCSTKKLKRLKKSRISLTN